MPSSRCAEAAQEDIYLRSRGYRSVEHSVVAVGDYLVDGVDAILDVLHR